MRQMRWEKITCSARMFQSLVDASAMEEKEEFCDFDFFLCMNNEDVINLKEIRNN